MKFKRTLAAIAAGAVIAVPLVVPNEASAAKNNTPPPPDPNSTFCQMYNGAVGQSVKEAFTALMSIDETLPQDELINQLKAPLTQLATGLAEAKVKSKATPYFASQLKEQSAYWSKASKAVNAGKKLTMAKLFSEKRLNDEVQKAMNLMDASEKYCDTNASVTPITLNLDTTTWDASNNKGTKVVKVTSGGPWTAVPGSDCGPIKVKAGSGKGNGQFKVVVPANSADARTCTVTVTAGGSTVEFKVNQAAKA